MANDLPIAIVGAGFSGLGMAIALKRAGHHNFTVFEAAQGVGGTWRDNTYPGCACDIPSHLYSYSFERNPNWSRSFSPQPEILKYLEHCTDKYGVRPHIRFGERVTATRWDERDQVWTVKTEAGTTTNARVVVSAPGPLAIPRYPQFEGLQDFERPCFHSARWDHDVDLKGKRVAVIGTGASAIQVIPAIAPEVQQLLVYQRSPAWVIPKPDGPISQRWQAAYRRLPVLTRVQRSAIYGALELLGTGLYLDPRLLRIREAIALRHMKKAIPDPQLRRELTPNYRMGCKRILPSNDFFPAMNRDNVQLITEGVERFTRTGIVTADGIEREVDVVVMCTGFDPRGSLTGFEVVGHDGKTLAEKWQDHTEAYYGIQVAGFPNFFVLVGPNTGLGHNSIVFMVEAQVHYIMQCLDLMRRGDFSNIEVRPAAQREFNDKLQARMNDVVWSSGCNSWYLDETGKNYTLWPGSTVEYWLRTRKVDPRALVAG